MEALADLRMTVEAETTEEGLDLFRPEVRDGWGNLVVCGRFSTSPVRAMKVGQELLEQARSDEAFRQARNEVRRLFTPAA